MTMLRWTATNGDILELNDITTGTRVLRGVEGLDAPPVNVATGPLVGRSGSSLINSRVPERDLLLPLLVTASAERLETEVAKIAAAITQGGTLTHRDSNHERTLLNVIYAGGLQGVRSESTALPTFRKFALSLIALDPWWYGETVSTPLLYGATVPFDDPATPFDALTGFDGSTPNTLTVSGDAAALPLTTITGPFTTLQVGVAGGETFRLTNALAAGSTLTVDTYPGRRGPSLNGGPVDWSLLTSASRLWGLPKGATVLNVGATGSTGASSITVSYRPRWLTP